MGLDIDFAFDVGDEEKHRVEFHWGQLFGRVRDHRRRRRGRGAQPAEAASGRRPRRSSSSVGKHEVHAVVIEKISHRFLGGARKQKCQAFVDGELVREYP